MCCRAPNVGKASGRTGYAVGDRDQGSGSESWWEAKLCTWVTGCDKRAVYSVPFGGERSQLGPIDEKWEPPSTLSANGQAVFWALRAIQSL